METNLQNVIDQSTQAAALHDWDATTKSIVTLAIVSGMAYLQVQNLIHRDMKAEKVLLDSNFHPRIRGFHFSTALCPKGQTRMTMNLGTPLFMAPEIPHRGDDYASPVDVYAQICGALLYVMLSEN
jgi:serine/threonine protein kinase